jgi:hypothetical protein
MGGGVSANAAITNGLLLRKIPRVPVLAVKIRIGISRGRTASRNLSVIQKLNLEALCRYKDPRWNKPRVRKPWGRKYALPELKEESSKPPPKKPKR